MIKTDFGTDEVVTVLRVCDYEDDTPRGFWIDYVRDDGRYGDAFVLEGEDYSAALKANSGMPYTDIKGFKWSYYGNSADKIRRIVKSYIDDWKKWRQSGRGLYICSEANGSGKTFLACCIGNELIRQYNAQVDFVTVNDYIGLMSEDKDRAFRLRDSVLLIVDDIGTQNEKQEWISDAVFRLVDYRYRQKLPTIYTSNMPLKRASKNDRVTSRMFELSHEIKMPDISVREILATKAKEEFLSEVIGAA